MKELTLDINSSVSETYGQQEGSAYHGILPAPAIIPSFVSISLEMWREPCSGNATSYSAKDWKSVLDPIVDRYRNKGIAFRFRGDAAFANPDLYEYLEMENFSYAIRLPAYGTLMEKIESFLVHPVGRPAERPHVRYRDFEYQAKSWNCPRRVIMEYDVASEKWARGGVRV